MTGYEFADKYQRKEDLNDSEFLKLVLDFIVGAEYQEELEEFLLDASGNCFEE